MRLTVGGGRWKATMDEKKKKQAEKEEQTKDAILQLFRGQLKGMVLGDSTRGDEYYRTPKWMYAIPGLGWAEIAVYSYLWSMIGISEQHEDFWDGDTPFVKVSVEKIGRELNRGRSTIEAATAKLDRLGLIWKDGCGEDGKACRYFVRIPRKPITSEELDEWKKNYDPSEKLDRGI